MDDKEDFIDRNSKLVYFTLKKYILPYNKIPDQEMPDILQEGYLALLKACYGYNSSIGYSESTYCVKCIYFNIIRYLEKTIYKNKNIDSLESQVIYDDENSFSIINCIKDTDNKNYLCDIVADNYFDDIVKGVLSNTKNKVTKESYTNRLNEIIKHIVDGRGINETSKIVGVSRQQLNNIIRYVKVKCPNLQNELHECLKIRKDACI